MDSFEFNAGFFEELGQSPGVKKLVREAADRVAGVMRDTAPNDSGDLARSIKVEQSPVPGRVVYRVGSESEYALAQEARTGFMARSVKRAR